MANEFPGKPFKANLCVFDLSLSEAIGPSRNTFQHNTNKILDMYGSKTSLLLNVINTRDEMIESLALRARDNRHSGLKLES